MKNRLLLTSLFVLISTVLSAQYNFTGQLADAFTAANKSVIKNFLDKQTTDVKILVLPILTENGQSDEYSAAIARSLSEKLQAEFQSKYKVTFYLKGDFDHAGMADLESFSVSDNQQITYWETLLEKMKPNFYIEGYYSKTLNNIQQEMVTLSSVRLQPYFYDASKRLEAVQLTGVSAMLTAADKSADVKTDAYVWATGTGTYYEKAESNANEALYSKIASFLQVKFAAVKPADASPDEFALKMTKSYTSAMQNKIRSKALSQTEGKNEVIKYISKDELSLIFDEREMQIRDYIGMGSRAEAELRIGDALLNYYRASVLAQSHPEYTKLRYDFGAGSLPLSRQLKEKIESLLAGIQFAVQSTESVSVQQHSFVLSITYNGKPVQNLTYKYWNGNGYSSTVRAVNGIGTADVIGAKPDNIRCKTEYMFAETANDDMGYAAVSEAVDLPVYPTSEKQSSGKSSSATAGCGTTYTAPNPDAIKTNTTLKTVEAETNTKPSNSATQTALSSVTPNPIIPLDAAKATDDVMKVVAAVKSKNYASVQSVFTPDGYDMFVKLMKYGNAEVIAGRSEYKLIQMNGRNIFRDVTMKFTHNGRVFIENVIFSFDENSKINSVAFALEDQTINEIMDKPWPEFDKYELLCFMENYKTAYHLKRLDYLKSIFSENALIIVGHVLQNAPKSDISGPKVAYSTYTKDQYMNKLEQQFKGGSFINLRFEDVLLQKGKIDHVYGIQLKQYYTGNSYADQGYLFLYIDIRDPKRPLIHVRTWQPERDPKGKIYGVDDFYFD